MRALEGATVGAGATSEEIAAAEAGLGVRFPLSYRAFLKRFGWLQYEGLEVFGLGSDAPQHLWLTKITLDERHVCAPPLPRSYIPVCANGFGEYYCINTGSPTGAVVLTNHDALGLANVEVIARDFAAWLREEMNDRGASAGCLRDIELFLDSKLEPLLEDVRARIRRRFKRGTDHDCTYEEVRRLHRSFLARRLPFMVFVIPAVWSLYGNAGSMAWVMMIVIITSTPMGFYLQLFFHPLRRTLVLMEEHNADTFSQLRKAVADLRPDRSPPPAPDA